MSDNFNKEHNELKALERQIINEMKIRKEMKKEDNTFKVEQNIKNLLENFQSKMTSINSNYVQKYSKSNKDLYNYH